jgi:hypothetical protein
MSIEALGVVLIILSLIWLKPKRRSPVGIGIRLMKL